MSYQKPRPTRASRYDAAVKFFTDAIAVERAERLAQAQVLHDILKQVRLALDDLNQRLPTDDTWWSRCKWWFGRR